MTDEKGKEKKYKWTAKRVIALIAIFLLVGVYVAAFVSAITSSPDSPQLFRFCIGMTIAVPIFSWIAIYAVGYLTHRHTIASMDILNSNKKARKEMEEGVAREMAKQEEEKKKKADPKTKS